MELATDDGVGVGTGGGGMILDVGGVGAGLAGVVDDDDDRTAADVGCSMGGLFS